MQFNLLVIRTAKPDMLVLFYQHLGLTFDYHQHGKGPMHYSTTMDEIVFEIYPLLKSQTQADTSLRLGFKVEKLDELIEQLKTKGVTIIQQPQKTEWGYVAVVKDFDGRKIELQEEYQFKQTRPSHTNHNH